jgi:hypothetical protein
MIIGDFNKMNVIRRLLFIFPLGLFLFHEPTFLLASDNKVIDYYKNPKAIMNEVLKRGSNTIISELYSHPNVWNFVLQKIATGAKSWLRVAVALHPGSDAGASEMLALSVGEALENSPEDVFRITLKEFQLESICSGPDIDDIRYNSYELAIKAIKRRQNRILAISNLKFKNAGEKCVQILEKSKDEVARFYEKNKK